MDCRKSKVQEYQCQVCVVCPNGKQVSVDACLVKELFYLWDRGIHTVGSCCGNHANSNQNTLSYIQVHDSCIDKMLELGYSYRINPNNPNIKDCFVPNTKLNSDMRIDYFEQIGCLSCENWGDYGWLATEHYRDIPSDIKKRINRVMYAANTERQLNSLEYSCGH